MALNRFFSYSQFRGVFLGAFGPVLVTATVPSTAAGANGTIAVTVAGLQTNDILVGVIPTTPTAGVSFTGMVTAANTFSLVANNGGVGVFNPGSATYTLLFLRVKTA